MPSSLHRLGDARCCSSTGRPFMPLSSQAVKPWSAAKLELRDEVRSVAEWARNMPKCGA
jgi:predicted phosphatase